MVISVVLGLVSLTTSDSYTLYYIFGHAHVMFKGALHTGHIPKKVCPTWNGP